MTALRFEGTQDYVATHDLKLAVNAAIRLQRPLLVKGEPGTGKTMLAEQVAAASGCRCSPGTSSRPPRRTRASTSTTRSSRLRDSQLGDRTRSRTIGNYIIKGELWQAFEAEQPTVVLIDEIDKADIEFPNDLLRELDRMEFHVYETRRDDQGARSARSSSSPRTTRRSCPTPSCAAASSTTSRFPDRDTMQRIVDVHFPGLKKAAADRGDGGLLRPARGRRASRRSPPPPS